MTALAMLRNGVLAVLAAMFLSAQVGAVTPVGTIASVDVFNAALGCYDYQQDGVACAVVEIEPLVFDYASLWEAEVSACDDRSASCEVITFEPQAIVAFR